MIRVLLIAALLAGCQSSKGMSLFSPNCEVHVTVSKTAHK